MLNSRSGGVIFSLELIFVIVAIALFTMTIVVAENYATSGHTLAEAEIATGQFGGE